VAEQFGGAAHTLTTTLSHNSFKKARKILEDKGLFSFTEVFERKGSKRARIVGYKVKNLHGYYNKGFWECGDESFIEVEEEPIPDEVIPSFHEVTLKDAEIPTEQESQNPNHVITPISQETTTDAPEITIENHSVISNHEVTLKDAEIPTEQDSQNPNYVINPISQEITTDAPEITVENHLMTNNHQMIPKSAKNLKHKGFQNSNYILTNIEQPKRVVQYLEKSPKAALEEGDIGVEQSKPLNNPLTKEEIFNWLDLAIKGVCPPDDVINQILETIYAVVIIQYIVIHPEWGIRIFQGRVTRGGEIEISDNGKWREERMRELANYDALGQCPTLEFLNCCWNDPPLQIKLKQVSKRYQWDLTPVTT